MKSFNHIPISRVLACIFGGMFVACSNDHSLTDPTLSEQAAIDFGCSLAEQEQQTTRAIGLETIHPSFHVWSYKGLPGGSMQPVMADYMVGYSVGSAGTTETNTADWEYVGLGTSQVVKYWDFTATSYRFWGYSGTDATISDNGTTLTIPGLRLSTTEPSTTLFSSLKVVEKTAFGQTVQLEFLRPYAKIRVGFYTSEPLSTGDEISINDITFSPTAAGNIPQEGELVIHYPLTGASTWNLDPGSQVQASLPYQDVTLTPTQGYSSDKAVTAKPNAEAEYYYVLPVGDSNPSFLLSATIEDEPKTAVVPANFMQWKPNFFYTYIFKIIEASKKIEFYDVKIDPWHYGGTQEVTWTNW